MLCSGGEQKHGMNDGDDTSQQHAPWQHRVKCVCEGKIKFMLKCEEKTIYSSNDDDDCSDRETWIYQFLKIYLLSQMESRNN